MTHSIFQFLQGLDASLANVAFEAEKSIWDNPRSTLIHGRLFGENLAKIVSEKEKIEPVYSIKQIDRLHKLAREGIISEEIRDRFEWLRMNGNTAAHNTKETPGDFALTAHRCIFELAIWFAESYGPLSIQLPAYQMPQHTVPEQNLPKTEEVFSERIEKVLLEKLEQKFLPSLDERFRGLEDFLVQFSKRNLDIWAKEVETVPAIIEEEKQMVVKSEIVETPEEADDSAIELADYLKRKGMEVIDKRPFGGTLWIIGGWDLNETLVPLKEYKCYFRFVKNGSGSTKRKQGWFLLGKDEDGKRWLPSAHPRERLLVDNRSAEKIQSPQEQAPVPVIEEPLGIKQSEKTIPAHVEVSEQAETVIVPIQFREKDIHGYPSRLSQLSEEFGIRTFGEWNEWKLKELYAKQPGSLHDVLIQLWFFGFGFQGQLGRFLNLHHEPEDSALEGYLPGIALEEKLAPEIGRMLERFGIRFSDQLNGLPVRSLEWLLKDRLEEVLTALDSCKKRMVSDPSVDKSALTFYFHDQEIDIPSKYGERLIMDLHFTGCQTLLRRMVSQLGYTCVADIPQNLALLNEQIKGIGDAAIQKFFNQLALFAPEPIVVAQNEPENLLPVREANRILWNEKELTLVEEEFDFELLASDFPATPLLLSKLIENGMKQLGDLPERFTELTNLPRVGPGVVEKFFVRLTEIVCANREAREQEQIWQGMSHEERISASLHRMVEKWENSLLASSNLESGENRNYQIFRYNWEQYKLGKKVTLEDTGQYFGITRERIRQIIKNVLRYFQTQIIEVERAIREACEEQQGYFFYPMKTGESVTHSLIVQSLETVGVAYIERYQWWTSSSDKDFENMIDNIKDFLHQSLRGMAVQNDDLESMLASYAENSKIPMELAQIATKQWLKETSDGRWILVNSRKSDLVEMVLREYPQGVEVYKKADQLIAQAKLLVPGSFEKERDFTSVISRDEFMEIAYLWGRGVYIHHSYVQADKELLQKVVQQAETLLKKRSPLLIGRLFSLFEMDLKAANIPTEYALYTLLRKQAPDSLSLTKFPKIWGNEDVFHLGYADLLKAYIRERNHPVALSELEEEFVKRQGWKLHTINNTISWDKEFVRTDFGVVGIKEFYPVKHDEFAPLVKKLDDLLEATPIIHVNRLFEETSSICKELGIHTPYILFDLLKGQLNEEYRLVRYPLIALSNQEWEGLNLQTLVEEYILEQGTEVSREEVLQWITEEVGAHERTLDFVLSASQDIYYYTRGQYGEYVHRANLEWDEEKERQLNEWVSRENELSNDQGMPFVLIKDLFQPHHFPILPEDMEWTRDLFVDCLKKSGQFVFIGSFDAICVEANKGIVQNDTEFVAFVLEHYFGGEAFVLDLNKKLAELDYSRDGQLLFDVMEKVQQGRAPFKMEGGRIQIR